MDVAATGAHSPALRHPERPQEAAENRDRAAHDSEIERREADRAAAARSERRDAEQAEDRRSEEQRAEQQREDAERQNRVDIRV